MKISRILPVVGMAALMACGGAAFAQTPNQIPMGAGAGVDRQPAGSRFRNPTNPPPTAPSTALPPAAAASPDKAAISASCTQQANAKGLHGKARKAFREKCKRNGGK